MKRMVLVVALIAATEAKAQDTGNNPSNQPKKAITTKHDGKNKDSTTPAQHGVRPAPRPTPTLPPAEKKNPRNDD